MNRRTLDDRPPFSFFVRFPYVPQTYIFLLRHVILRLALIPSFFALCRFCFFPWQLRTTRVNTTIIIRPRVGDARPADAPTYTSRHHTAPRLRDNKLLFTDFPPPPPNSSDRYTILRRCCCCADEKLCLFSIFTVRVWVR